MRAQTLNRCELRAAAGAASLVGLLLAVCALGGGLAQGQASQSSSPQSSAQQSTKPPAQQPVSAPIVMGQDPESTEDAGGATAVPVSQPAASSVPATPMPRPARSLPATAPVQPAAAAAVPVPVPANAGDDGARQQINNECANLLQMANDLKAAVDKSNKDMLSMAVVRKANEIETLAHHVKDEMRPEVGKN